MKTAHPSYRESPRDPSPDERVKLANIAAELVVLAVRKNGSAVDLHLGVNASAVMNKVLWNHAHLLEYGEASRMIGAEKS